MRVFGLEVFQGGRLELLDEIFLRMERGEKTFLVTLNAQMALRAKMDRVYFQILRSSDFVVVDGMGVKLALGLKYGRSVERYPGVELMTDILAFSRIRGWKVYLLGSEDGVVRRLAEILRENGVDVVGYHHGYFSGEGPVEEIEALSPDVVFVAMGVPKQEEWIFSNLDRFDKGLFMGVGGSFDVLAGFKRRAPVWMRRIGLEWLYRFLKEPRKRWKTPFELVSFGFLVLLEMFKR